MVDIEKVIKGLERCLKHTCPDIYSKDNGITWTNIDKELIRINNGTARADIIGLSAGNYKINVDDFFGDIIAIDKKENESIDYDDYPKYWIKDWLCKKDFLYYNL